MNSMQMHLPGVDNLFSNLIQYSRWPLGCLVFFLWSCGHKIPDTTAIKKADTSLYLHTLDSMSAALKTGDLVFRRGNDFASQTFANMNLEDRRFSHVGLVSFENEKPYIFHAIGGSFNPDQKIKKEPLEVFAAPDQNRSFGVYRGENAVPALLSAMLDSLYNSGVPFDLMFDLESDDRLYCSEMVYKVMKRCQPTVRLHPSLAKNKEYVSTETFTLSKDLNQIIFCELK